MKQVGIIPIVIGAGVSLFGMIAGAIEKGDADKAKLSSEIKAREFQEQVNKDKQEFWSKNIPILAISGVVGLVVLVKIFKKKNNE